VANGNRKYSYKLVKGIIYQCDFSGCETVSGHVRSTSKGTVIVRLRRIASGTNPK